MAGEQPSSGDQTPSTCAVAWGGVQVSSYYLCTQEHRNVQPTVHPQPWTQPVTAMPSVS